MPSDKIEDALFDGLDEIPVDGCPGTLIITDCKAKPILTANHKAANVIFGAVEYGMGKIFIACHDSFIEWFDKDEHKANELKAKLIRNLTKWLTTSQANDDHDVDIPMLNLNDYNTDTCLTDFKILKWIQDTNVDEQLKLKILEYLHNGGSLAIGCTPWGFLQMNPGKSLENLSVFRFSLDHMGIMLTDDCLFIPEQKLYVKDNLAKYSSFPEFLPKLESLTDLSPYYGAIDCGLQLTKIQNNLVNRNYLYKINTIILNECRTKSIDPFPRDSNLIKNQLNKDLSLLMCRTIIESATGHVKAPYIDAFPGDYTKLPTLLENVEISLSSKYGERISTGYYLPAGICLILNVIENEEDKDWYVRVGPHTDNINNCDSYSRWPIISTCGKVKRPQTKFSSPFGGLIYLESPFAGGHINISISNVVESPFIDVNQAETVANWNERRHALGLWAELCGEHVIFTCPSESIRELDDPIELLTFWDSILKTHHELRGTNPYDYRRERVVSDKQISAGYMHSGYPICTHLDICDKKRGEFIYDMNKLKPDGCWGLKHEFGHNLQRSEWTFDGSVEVTVNLFSMHAMDHVIGKSVLKQTWVLGHKNSFKKYFSKKPTYADWQSDYGMALMVFVQLIKHFGWDPMRKFMSDYESDISNKVDDVLPKTNQDKIDQWVVRYSKIIKKNIKTQFEMWGLPVSNDVDPILACYENWCPIDEMDADRFFEQQN